MHTTWTIQRRSSAWKLSLVSTWNCYVARRNGRFWGPRLIPTQAGLVKNGMRRAHGNKKYCRKRLTNTLTTENNICDVSRDCCRRNIIIAYNLSIDSSGAGVNLGFCQHYSTKYPCLICTNNKFVGCRDLKCDSIEKSCRLLHRIFEIFD